MLTARHSSARSFAAEEWVKWTEPPAGTPLLQDLADPASPNAHQRYAFSKLVSIFLSRQLASLPRAAGLVVDVVCPGLCLSELVRHCDDEMRRGLQAKSLPTAEGAKNVSPRFSSRFFAEPPQPLNQTSGLVS